MRGNGSIMCFSARLFQREVLAAAAATGPGMRWLLIDLLLVGKIDATGVFAVRDAFDALLARGIIVAAAGRDTEWADRSARRGLSGVFTGIRILPTPPLAELACRKELRHAPSACAE